MYLSNGAAGGTIAPLLVELLIIMFDTNRDFGVKIAICVKHDYEVIIMMAMLSADVRLV